MIMPHFYCNMKNKCLLIVSLLSWANIGLIYLLHLNEIYTTLIVVYKELTTIPSFLCGTIFPVWLLIKMILNKIESNK
jgi:hypothetical protein